MKYLPWNWPVWSKNTKELNRGYQEGNGFFQEDQFYSLTGKFAGVLAITAITTVLLHPLKEFLGLQIVALIFLLPVILAAFLWGVIPGILAGITSFLAFNYFFIPPYFTLLVHRLQDLITLFVFLFVAVFTSQLIAKARTGMQLAKRHEWEATSLYQLILSLVNEQDMAYIAHLLAVHTLNTIHCNKVEIQITGNAGIPAAILVNEKKDIVDEAVFTFPMLTQRSCEGEIRVWMDHPVLTGEEDRLLSMYANQGALAVERIRLFQVETKSHILEETNQAKSTLLSSVSHELRSPLAVIKASVSSLRSGMIDWDSEAHQELLATVEEETDQLNFLVGNLLDMSRIEAGSLTLHKKWNSLGEIATGVSDRMRKILQPYQLNMDIPPDLPLVLVDYFLIEQVFTNLISNSVKFAPPGSQITITSKYEDAHLHTRVINQGPAVPESNLERIFDKFNQVHQHDKITGTGLGLSICKGIVQAHNGQIWAENSTEGFVLHFTLPTESEGSKPHFPPEITDE